MASLNRMEARSLDVISDGLNNCYFKLKKAKSKC